MTARGRVVVVGGGITGLAALHRLASRIPPAELMLVERAGRLGGVIDTERRDGFLLEGGPDSFLAAKPAGLALCFDLGLEGGLIGTEPEHRGTYVKRAGRLHRLPEGFSGLVPARVGPLFTAGMLSLAGRLRAGLEPIVPRRRVDEDESVGAFVRRRFGREAWDWVIEPLLSGIYAGDGDRLALSATFPQLQTAEREHGSVLRAMSRSRRPHGSGVPRGFLAPAGGMAQLVGALAGELAGARILLNRAALRLERREPGYQVLLANGEVLEADAVILALPAGAAAALLADFDPTLAQRLARIPQVSTATVSLGFRRSDLARIPRGYGYVSPRAEGGPLVALSWTSNKFSSRAPAAAFLARAFLGRAGDDAIVEASDSALIELVRAELRAVMGIEAEPILARVRRWPRALPQYTIGHAERRRAIDERLDRHPGLAVAGASFDGVGIPDCIASGWRAAAGVTVERAA